MAGVHPGRPRALARAGRVRPGPGREIRRFVVHLRLPFQLLLAPIFMLGALLAGARPGGGLLLAFLAVHAGIYGGMTAYNSFYDRDRGPIGLLKHPEPPGRFVRDAAIVVQMTALALLLVLAPAAAVPAAALVALGIAYSHPRWRWKASLGRSLLAVSVGQGALAFAVGYLAGGAPVAGLLTPAVAGAALAAAIVTLGLYPVTQLYQIEEDRARGDRTLAIAIGWRGSLVVSALLLAAGVGLLVVALAGRIAALWSVLLPAGVGGLWVLLGLWWRRFESLDAYRNHDWAMAVGTLASSAFWVFITCEWIRAAR